MTYHFRIRTACGGIVNTSQWGERIENAKYRLLKRYPGATIIDMSAAIQCITFMTVTSSFLGLISRLYVARREKVRVFQWVQIPPG